MLLLLVPAVAVAAITSFLALLCSSFVLLCSSLSFLSFSSIAVDVVVADTVMMCVLLLLLRSMPGALSSNLTHTHTLGYTPCWLQTVSANSEQQQHQQQQ